MVAMITMVLIMIMSTTTLPLLSCHAWTTMTTLSNARSKTMLSHRHTTMRHRCQNKNHGKSETRRDNDDCDAENTCQTNTVAIIQNSISPSSSPSSHHHAIKRRNDSDDNISLLLQDRRKVLQQSTLMLLLGGLSLLSGSESARAAVASDNCLTDLTVGQGSWQPLSKYNNNANENHDDAANESTTNTQLLPASFVSYGTRVVLHYDPGVQEWWEEEITRRRHKRNNVDDDDDDESEILFTSLASSLGRTWQDVITSSSSSQRLYEQYLANYPKSAQRQINIWFAFLPYELQPKSWQLQQQSQQKNTITTSSADTEALTQFWEHDRTAMLPEPYHVTFNGDTSTAHITPTLPDPLMQGLSSSLSSSSSPLLLTREQPVYGPAVYATLGVAGGVGCALTHATVIPLDVIKTRAQMADATSTSSPSSSSSKRNLLQQAERMVERQGWSSLFLGAQATIVGYLWYGISVYPTYTATKRWLWANDMITDTLNPDAIALLAGALAAVVASLGLTPLEAARIRAVANPRKYAKAGVTGTLQVLAEEQVLYAGFPSLLTRQVVFGSIKFLAFERFAMALSNTWPDTLGSPDVSWLVSLLAGGLSGFVSATVSQPADSLLTYVSSQKRTGSSSSSSNNNNNNNNNNAPGKNLNLWQGLQQLWTEEGPGALFRGLGSRSIWAGSIIAGQFFLYDIFRTAAGVSTVDLTQVWDYQINL